MLKTPMILLCAGNSSRFGSPKGLVPFRGHTWLRHQLLCFAQYSECPIFLILGAHADLYEEEIENILEQTEGQLPLEQIHNPKYEEAPFTSIHLGVKTILHGGYTSAFIQPVDTPVPTRSTLEAMSLAVDTKDIVVPAYQGVGGHPVLLTHDFLKAVTLADPQKQRLDQMIRDWPSQRYLKLEVVDPLVTMSFNTPDEFSQLQGYLLPF